MSDEWQDHSWNSGQWMSWQSEERYDRSRSRDQSMNWQSTSGRTTRGATSQWNWRRRKTAAERRASGTVLWAVSSSSFSAVSKVCILTAEAELTGIAEELLQGS